MYHQVIADLAMDVIGPSALIPEGRMPSGIYQTDDIGSPYSTMSWAVTFLDSRSETIYAGTSEIQRNIIAERTLGLPR
jgi:alkylation response protein AidB-like acyl-CoA dehydrogenase